MWNIIRRTLHDLPCLYSSSQEILLLSQSAKGHFVTLIKVGLHLITCNPGHILKFWSLNGKKMKEIIIIIIIIIIMIIIIIIANFSQRFLKVLFASIFSFKKKKKKKKKGWGIWVNKYFFHGSFYNKLVPLFCPTIALWIFAKIVLHMINSRNKH